MGPKVNEKKQFKIEKNGRKEINRPIMATFIVLNFQILYIKTKDYILRTYEQNEFRKINKKKNIPL